MASGARSQKGKAETSTAAPPSSPADAAVGPFAADCANAALREEVKKLYAAIFKKVAVKEGKPSGGRGWGMVYAPDVMAPRLMYLRDPSIRR